MAEDNIILHFPDKRKKRQLFVKKIKLTNFPELEKNFNDFFNNEINYFNNNYKNNLIIVGKMQNNREKEGIVPKIKYSKSKNKKYYFNSPSKTNSPRLISDENSHENKKRVVGKIIKDNSLKIGQKYIDDNQIDDLFNKFKIVKKLNKSKTKNFITVKDLIEKKIKLSEKNLLSLKLKENNEYKNRLSTCTSNPILNIENLEQINSSKNFFESFSQNFNKNLNKELKTKNKYATTSNFYIGDKIIINRNNIKKRKKLIDKQGQFLLFNKDKKQYNNKSEKRYFAEILANQEEALLKSSKSETKLDYISNKISNKINKDKNDLLIQNIENYRIKYEILSNIDKNNKILGPEHFYNWRQDLRTMPNTKSIKAMNLYNIRNPLIKQKKINLFKKVHSLKNLKKIINSVNKTSYNLKGLIVKGQDLWQLENDFAKSLKNKKIINNFESYLPTAHLQDKYFCVNHNLLNKN